MTNSSLSSVLNLSAVLSLAGLCGCGDLIKPEVTVDGLVEEASAALAAGRLVDARAAVSNAFELAASDVDVRLLKAQVDFHDRNYDSAAKIFRGIADDAGLDRKVRAQGWSGLAVIDLCREDRDSARLDCMRALRMDGKNASAWYHLGYIYYNSFKYYEAASDCYECFVRLESADPEKVKKAQRTYIPALREERTNSILEIPGARTPDRAACTKALQAAEAAIKKRTFKTARLRYQEALKADPTSAPAAVGYAKLLLRSGATAADKKLALDYYCRACKLNPSSTSTFIAAAELAVSLGNYLTARKLYSRAVAADRTNVTAIDGLIRALRKTNQSKTASAYQLYREFLALKIR